MPTSAHKNANTDQILPLMLITTKKAADTNQRVRGARYRKFALLLISVNTANARYDSLGGIILAGRIAYLGDLLFGMGVFNQIFGEKKSVAVTVRNVK